MAAAAGGSLDVAAAVAAGRGGLEDGARSDRLEMLRVFWSGAGGFWSLTEAAVDVEDDDDEEAVVVVAAGDALGPLLALLASSLSYLQNCD